MNEELIEILEKVGDAIDASPQETDALEALLMEDPIAFAERYAEHLEPEERALLGSVSPN